MPNHLHQLNHLLDANPDQKTFLRDITNMRVSPVLSFLDYNALAKLARTDEKIRLDVYEFLYAPGNMKKIFFACFPHFKNSLSLLFPGADKLEPRMEEFTKYNISKITKEIEDIFPNLDIQIKKEYIFEALQRNSDYIVVSPDLDNSLKLKLLKYLSFTGSSAHMDESQLLRIAVNYNQSKTVRFLTSEMAKILQNSSAAQKILYKPWPEEKGNLLLRAVQNNHREILEILLSSDKELPVSLQISEKHKIQAAVRAANIGKITLLKVLINHSLSTSLTPCLPDSEAKNDNDPLSEVIAWLKIPLYQNSFTRNLLISLGCGQISDLTEWLLPEDSQNLGEAVSSILLYAASSLNLHLIKNIFDSEHGARITIEDRLTAFSECLEKVSDNELEVFQNIFFSYIPSDELTSAEKSILISSAANNSNPAVLNWAMQRLNNNLSAQSIQTILCEAMRKHPKSAITLTQLLLAQLSTARQSVLAICKEAAFRDNVALIKAMLAHPSKTITEDFILYATDHAIMHGAFNVASYFLTEKKELLINKGYCNVLLRSASISTNPLGIQLVLPRFF